MNTEIEAKFIDVDIDDVRARLEQAGARCIVPMRDMIRTLYEPTRLKERNAFIRVRHEGEKTTLTYKQFTERSLTGAKEIEVAVSDYDATVAILDQLGLQPITTQESRRETWQLGDVEVVIDEWPWLKPYIEIEAQSEDAVRAAANKLGFEWSDAVFGSVDAIYELKFPDKTNRGVIDIREVRFGAAIPQEFTPKR